MTQNTTQDYSDTVEREKAIELIDQLNTCINLDDYVHVTDEMLDAVKYFRNEQTQAMLKEANND